MGRVAHQRGHGRAGPVVAHSSRVDRMADEQSRRARSGGTADRDQRADDGDSCLARRGRDASRSDAKLALVVVAVSRPRHTLVVARSPDHATCRDRQVSLWRGLPTTPHSPRPPGLIPVPPPSHSPTLSRFSMWPIPVLVFIARSCILLSITSGSLFVQCGQTTPTSSRRAAWGRKPVQ